MSNVRFSCKNYRVRSDYLAAVVLLQIIMVINCKVKATTSVQRNDLKGDL